MGGRCSDDGLAEPMIVLVVSLSAPEYGGALFRRRARRADESHPSGVSFRVFIGVALFARRGNLGRRQLPSFYRVALFARQARRVDESHSSGVSFRVLSGGVIRSAG